jgi:hypothetical protein
METRLAEERALGVMKALGFPNGEVVSADGLSGGLALFWRRDVVVSLQSKSRSHIDVLLASDSLSSRQWRFTGFYGDPKREMRKNSWYLMRFLRAQSDLPWLCAGDFNEVLKAEEHFGINERERWQMVGFQEVVADRGFLDLGFTGLPYTWDDRQNGDHNVKVRLDRALGDHKFMDVFGETLVKHVPTTFSYHVALLVDIKEANLCQRRRSRAKQFRYEQMWQRHDSYVDFVNQAWDPGAEEGSLLSVADSLSKLQSSLATWDAEVFGSVRQKLKSLRAELELERNSTLYRGPTERERGLMRELAEMLAREEEMERQRSRADWLKAGDRNTGFFQAKAKARGGTNRIRLLKRADGSEETEQEGLERAKAYDRGGVELSAYHYGCYGLSGDVVQFDYEMLSSVSFSVRINGACLLPSNLLEALGRENLSRRICSSYAQKVLLAC